MRQAAVLMLLALVLSACGREGQNDSASTQSEMALRKGKKHKGSSSYQQQLAAQEAAVQAQASADALRNSHTVLRKDLTRSILAMNTLIQQLSPQYNAFDPGEAAATTLRVQDVIHQLNSERIPLVQEANAYNEANRNLTGGNFITIPEILTGTDNTPNFTGDGSCSPLNLFGSCDATITPPCELVSNAGKINHQCWAAARASGERARTALWQALAPPNPGSLLPALQELEGINAYLSTEAGNPNPDPQGSNHGVVEVRSRSLN